jgi:hypothetical protein
MSTSAKSNLEESQISDDACLEYREAMCHHQANSLLRRQGLAFAGSFQIVQSRHYQRNWPCPMFKS